ncbi:hypothetical protein Hdeb2414_s0002g00058651 [Helianthus debilis subsp. tardiflorus]
MLREKWRYFYHVIMQCFAPRKLGMDGMGHNLLLVMIGLTFNQPYNFARMIFQALQAQIGYEEGDSRLMMQYPWFLVIIYRHLISDLPIHEGLAPQVLIAIGRCIFSDCRNVKASIHSPRLSKLRLMMGAILGENYNLENDQTWINIYVGVNQIFGAGEDEDGVSPIVLQRPTVVQPQVDPQQPSVVIEEPLVPEPAVVEPNVVEHVAD